MALNFLTANMSLVVPVVGQDPGPSWADDLNASLLILDSHNHSPGSGVPITPSGLNINTDLTFQNVNNAVGLRSVRFFNNGAPLSLLTDIGCLYEAGNELYYNDGIGNQVKITNLGSVSGAAGTITGLPSGSASAAYISGQGTFQFQQATATAANIDVGSVIVRYPGSYPTPAGNAIIIEAPSSLASLYSLTLPALPAQTNVMTLGNTGIISSITYDQVGQAMTSVGANAIAATMTITGVNSIFATSFNANLPGFAVQAGGKNVVVSETNASLGLAIVRGQVLNTGAINNGEGFTVSKLGTGDYLITFTSPFADIPVITLTTILSGALPLILSNSPSDAEVVILSATAGFPPANVGFNFIAVGQRG